MLEHVQNSWPGSRAASGLQAGDMLVHVFLSMSQKGESSGMSGKRTYPKAAFCMKVTFSVSVLALAVRHTWT